MRILIGVAATTAAIALAGCTTTLNSKNIIEGAQSPSSGVLYSLPMAVFDVEAKFLVTSCVPGDSVDVLGYELSGGAVQQKFAPDPIETYRLDYAELNSALKTTSASVTMHSNGMIKSVNADVEDRTAQVLTSFESVALNLFRASSFVPLAGAKKCDGRSLLQAKIESREKVLGQLPAAKAADESLAKDKQAAVQASTDLEVAATQLADAQKAKDNVAIADLAPKVAKLKAKLNAALRGLEGRSLQVPALQAQLAKDTEALTVTLTLGNWAPREKQSEVCQTLKAKQKDFVDGLGLKEGITKSYVTLPDDKFFEAEVCVAPLPGSRATAAPTNMESTYGGIVYRSPTIGAVWIHNKDYKTERLTALANAILPQYGAKGLIWLENKNFDKNNVKAAFNEDGTLSELTFTAQARAERAASAASEAASTVVELMKLRADAIKTRDQAADDEQKKAQQKQLDAIDDQIALLQKRKNLEAARLPTMDAYDKQKEQLRKEIDLEKLRQELADLKKKGSTQ